jgi:predicted kinase
VTAESAIKPQARLIIVCGLPGSGKTTHSRQLATEIGGIRFCPDEWMTTLGIDFYDAAARDRIEALQAQVAMDVLRNGGTAIIEWGTWFREERDRLREAARLLGAAVELHFLDEPIDALWERLGRRGAECPQIGREDLQRWSDSFQRPSREEMALFDGPAR